MSFHRILGVCLSLVVFLFSGAALAEQKVAVVDVQRAVASTEDGLRAQATLKKLFDNRQQELNKKQTELQNNEKTSTSRRRCCRRMPSRSASTSGKSR